MNNIYEIVSGFSGVTNYDIFIKVGKAKFLFTPEFITNHKKTFTSIKSTDILTDYDISTNTTTYIFTCEDTKSIYNMLKRLVK